MFFAGCFNDLLDPIAPSWDVNVTFPLVNRVYSLAEITSKDTSILRVGAGNQLMYSANVQSGSTYVGDLIKIDPINTSVNVALGTFAIAVPPLTVPIQIPFLPQGMTVTIPDTTVNLPDAQGSMGVFDRVTFRSGRIDFSLRNNLPVPIEITDPIVLRDDQNNVVATFALSPSVIPANGLGSASDNLDNKTMTQSVRMTGVRIHVFGSGSPVQIPTGDLLVTTLTTSNLQVSQAVLSQVPPQFLQNNDTTYLAINDSTLVKEVRIKSGNMNLAFSNNIALGVVLRFRFNQLLRRVGTAFLPFEDSLFLPANGSGSFTIDVSGYRIQSADGDFVRSLQTVSSVNLAGSGGQRVTVNDTDKIAISVSSSTPIIADSAVGVLKPTWIQIDQVVPLDFGSLPTKFSGQLSIPSANLAFTPAVNIGFPLDLEIQMVAKKNGTGDMVYLQFPAAQKRITASSGTLQFDPAEVGQFLTQLAGKLPDSLRIIGNVVVNPPGAYDPTLAGIGSVGRNTSFGGGVQMDIPLRLSITNGSFRDTLVLGDSTGDGEKDFDPKKEPISSLNYGKMYLEVNNAIPLQVGINMSLMNALRQPLLLIPQSGSPIQFNAPAVDGAGDVVVPAKSTAIIELSYADVQQFNPSEFMAYAVSLMTTPGSPAVRFKTTDYIQIRIWSALSYRVNK